MNASDADGFMIRLRVIPMARSKLVHLSKISRSHGNARYAAHRNPISLQIRKTDKLKKVDRAMRSTFFMSVLQNV